MPMILTLPPSSARRLLRSPSTLLTACMFCRSAWRYKFTEGCLIQPTYSIKRQGLLNAGGFALFIADGAQSQGQQFLRLQYGINIAGITLRITKGSIQQRFGNAGRLYAQPACAGQADRPGCRFPRCLWPPRKFQTVRKSPPFPLSPSSQIPP